MRKVYVAHPYGGKEENKVSVERIIKQLINKEPDTLFISPIHALGFMYDDVDYFRGMGWCIELLKSCDALYLCDGWKDSRGCNMEYKYAVEHFMEIKMFLEGANNG